MAHVALGAAEAAIREVFDNADVDGFLHVIDLDSGLDVAVDADVPVVTASTFKLPILVELFRQGDSGDIDLAERVTVPVADRAPGPTGISGMLDEVTMSWRDLAFLMIVVSDNAATDVIAARLGLANVNATMRALGLVDTSIDLDCRGIFATMTEDAQVDSLDAVPLAPDPELLSRLRAVRAEDTDRTTPRDMTRLLSLVYSDRAASASACAQMRRILQSQVWPHRLASGFPEDDVVTGGKTGTIVTWRNEVGVAEFADGGRYAAAVYTRARRPRLKHPEADAAIGRAARFAVDAIRTAPRDQ